MPAVLGSKEARLGVIIFPDVEKSCSHGTLVAGIHSICFATVKMYVLPVKVYRNENGFFTPL